MSTTKRRGSGMEFRYLVTVVVGGLLGIGSVAFGADRAGNGGEGILCHPSSGDSVQLLDYYEGHVLRGLDVNIGAPELEPFDKVRVAIERIARFDIDRAEKYANRLETFT